jgi:chromosome segregation ATPase
MFTYGVLQIHMYSIRYTGAIMLLFALLLVLVVLLIWTRDRQMTLLTKQARKCKRVREVINKCESELESCREEVKSFEDGVRFQRLEAALKEANEQVDTLAEQLLLHKQMLTQANEIADGYQNPSRTYTGLSREFALISQSGAWTQDPLLRQKLHDRDAMINALVRTVQHRTAEVNGLMADLMQARYGGTRMQRQKPASIANWRGPQ